MSTSPAISFVKGPDRGLIKAEEVQALKTSGALVIDERRSRTRYFNGRFLSAKDQTRDQQYFLARLADLGKAGGMGVVSGLGVQATGPGSIRITAGQGVTPAGETVMAPDDLNLSLADIAAAQQLDVAFGISRIPEPLARNRSGLFILGLRPVEYTANPIASYPTTLNGARTVQDGDIIEAAAVVLVPYVEQGQQGSAETRQARVAHSIFIDRGPIGTPEDVLPLAMIALDRGVIQWVDMFMVRREIGAAAGTAHHFGFSDRPLREAYLQQYLNQMQQVLQRLSGAAARFPASQYFASLPSAGVLPTAAIDPSDFSQIFFPPQIQTDISIIPEDELGVLVEESFMLPPIELTAAAEDLESTSVLILATVPRSQIGTLKVGLSTLTSSLKPAAPGMVFQRKPIEALRGLISLRLPPAPLDTGTFQGRAWRDVLARNPLLWYVRRRNLQVRQDILGVTSLAPPSDIQVDTSVSNALRSAGLLDRFTALKSKASSAAVADLTARLASPAIAANPVLAASVFSKLEKAPQLDRVTILEATETLADPAAGEGLAHIDQTNPGIKDPEVMKAVAESGAADHLDAIGRTVDKTKLTELTNQVIAIAKTAGSDAPTKIAELLKSQPKPVRTPILRVPR